MGGSARSQSTDPFHMHRFHVTDDGGALNLAFPAAGFNTLVAPEWVLGVIEYQEGIDVYRRKFPGESTFTALTLTKGVVKNDSSFFQWLRAGAEGQPYRTNITIHHYHRDDVQGLTGSAPPGPFASKAVATRQIVCYNAFATRVKMGSDFDATAADISIEDIDVEFEFFRLFVNGQEVKAASITTS